MNTINLTVVVKEDGYYLGETKLSDAASEEILKIIEDNLPDFKDLPIHPGYYSWAKDITSSPSYTEEDYLYPMEYQVYIINKRKNLYSSYSIKQGIHKGMDTPKNLRLNLVRIKGCDLLYEDEQVAVYIKKYQKTNTRLGLEERKELLEDMRRYL